ncbi:MAG TPA: site-specific integrase [Aeromicrobium sp.]|nr:site-specific integrase [Aeromicrobium sp.]
MPRRAAPKVETYEGARKTTYRVRVRVGGKQSTETFDSYAAAHAFAETVKHDGAEAAVAHRDVADINSAGYVPTLAEMLDRHCAELTGVEPRTRADYLSVAKRSWLPILGRLRVSQVNRQHVAKWVNAQDGQSAPKTIKNAHSVLSAVLESAVREGYLASNPARGTRLPRAGEEDVDEIRFLTHAEFDRLLAEVPERWQPFVVLLFGTGLRFSEATALQVHDINPETGVLRVMRAWKLDKAAPGGRRLGPPKSKAGRRAVWLGDVVLDAVKPLLDRPGSEFLFTAPSGKPVRHSNFRARIWVPACDAAGLSPRPRIHDARHSHASWLIAQGIRLEVIQDRLGHEDYATTRKVYGHLLPDLRREAGMAAAAAFANTSLGRPASEITALTDGP